MELRYYLSILRRRAIPIVLTVIVAAVLTYATTDRTPIYSATSTIYVGASRFAFEANSEALSGDRNAGIQRLNATFARMIDSDVIAREALAETGVARSALGVVSATEVLAPQNTNILTITVSDSDPAVAQALATGMAEAFIGKIRELEPGQSVGEGDLPSAPATIFERAQLPLAPQTSSALPNMVVAALFGFLLSAGVAFLIEYLDITFKTPEDAERRLNLPVLGTVPVLARQGSLIRAGVPRQPSAGPPDA